MKQLNSEKSFTLVELLIVISIIGILSLITFPYYQSAKQRLALQRAASGLVQDLRRAQEMATSTARAENCFYPPNHPSKAEEPKDADYEYGFGVNFKIEENGASRRDRYILYADCNGNYKYGGSDQDMTLNLVDFDVIEIGLLPNPENPGQSFERLNIIFVPPDPTVIFWIVPPDGGSNVSEVSIILRVKNDPTKTKTITVNKAGLIFIE